MGSPDRPDGAHDATRREFFRTFGRQTVQQAGAVVGAAAELRRSSMVAARELLDMPAAPGRFAEAPAPPVAEGNAEWTFRSAYRFTGDTIVIVDQRELSGGVTTVGLREPSEVAAAVRSGAVNSGPVLAEIGAYAMVLAAQAAVGRTESGHQQLVRAAAGTLRAARREVRAMAWAIDRMEARHDVLADGGAEATAVAEALRAEADEIASEATAAHAAIGRLGAQEITPRPDGPLNLLMHGDMGPLSCGMVGMGTALLQALAARGSAVHVWLTEAAPSGEGARIAALQLAQLDIAHTIVPDSAAGWLFDHRRLDGVLLRGDRICVNGDCGVLIGGLAVARLAAASGVPVHVLASATSFDPEAEDGAAIRVDHHSAAETLAGAPPVAGDRARPALFGVRLSPASDVVPAGLVTSIVTESGAHAPGAR